MDHFKYRHGALAAEDVLISKIAAEVGTPFYLYSSATLLHHYELFDKALCGVDHQIFYAMKAASNQAILKLLADAGSGMDVVSGGEYARARAAGVPGELIVFSGVGKTRSEMEIALNGGIRQFNIESEPEMQLLSEVASSMGQVAPVTIRINPNIDAKTHSKISTGKKEDKFGIPISRARDVFAVAAQLPGIKPVGIDVHIGSQLIDLEPYGQAYDKVAELTEILRADGHLISRLDLGGGLGIPYKKNNQQPPTPEDYAALVRNKVGHLGCQIEIEPGRLIAGNAGILVSEVIYVKEGEDRTFLIVDSAMNDLIRPALYDAYHEILPIQEPKSDLDYQTYDVVGPVCESGDTFAKERWLPSMTAGDLLAFRSAGAYGSVMASEYNSRPLVPEVLVRNDQFAVIRERPTYQDMINRDITPKWL